MPWSSSAWWRFRSFWGVGCGITGLWLRLIVHAVVAWPSGPLPCLSCVKVERRRASLAPSLPRPRALAVASTLQIVLGIVALVYLLPFDGTPRPVSFYQAVVRTGHQTNGRSAAGGDGRADTCGPSVIWLGRRPAVRAELERDAIS